MMRKTLLKRNLNSSTACALAMLALAGGSAARGADVTYERLLNPEPQNWLMHHRDYGAQRRSPLDAINKSNVKGLKLLFAVPLGGKSAGESLQATPLVEDGFMYMVDSWGVVQNRRAIGYRRQDRLENGPETRSPGPQPRCGAVGQSGDLGD